MTDRTPLFSSRRERRLWTWAFATAGAIYATIGLASALEGVFDDQALAAAVFLASMLLIGMMVLAQGLLVRPGGVEIGISFGLAAVYAMLLLRMTIPERTHLIEYSVLAAFVYEALIERSSRGRTVPAPAMLGIGVTVLIGALDEVLQAFVPSRVFDVVDILFNALAAVMAIAAIVLLRWVRRVRLRSVHSGDEDRRSTGL